MFAKLFSYANGLECFGYRQSPLEAMAYDAETAFASSMAIFNVEKMVAEKLGLLNRKTPIDRSHIIDGAMISA